MKRLFSLVVLGLFSAAVVGCEASGRVDTDNVEDGTSKSVKKTTVTEPDGDRTTKTEVRTDR